MTVKELCGVLPCEIIAGESGADREVTGGYCGDLLSWVMGNLKSGDAWLTVMGNVNTVAVAVLADASCILLCEDAPLDEDACARANSQSVPVLKTAVPMYEMTLRLGEVLSSPHPLTAESR